VAVPHEVGSVTPLDPSRSRSRRVVPQVPSEARTHLRAYLVSMDAAAIALAWSITLIPWPQSGRTVLASVLLVPIITVVGVSIINTQGLYRARNSAIRTLEMTGIARSTLILGVLAWLGARAFHVPFGTKWIYGQAIVGIGATLAFLIVSRSAYRAWLSGARRSGRYVRNVLLVGTNEEAKELLDLLSDHIEVGFRVVGVLGDRDAAFAHGLDDLWCGTPAEAVKLLAARHATGVVVATGAIRSNELNELVRQVQQSGAHIQLSAGMDRVDYRRLRALPVAYQPLFYVEPPVMARRNIIAKRIIDLVVASAALVVMSPLLLVIAVAIRLQDGGPVLFKQVRVGSNGRLFRVFKFRTMVVDAEERLAALQDGNERNGPLFKMTDDPRVTRIGRWLRESSLDELPQLINVVRGGMSLVGPRPALPSEVEAFDEELSTRTRVPPGITGLWQVEARDNPSFAAYRRLDLYYVENWSVSLDVVILVATVEQVVARFATAMLRRRRTAEVV
jgi:exopolysaccharide biosynthesis polyprenyl glycosylphosphotransferase